MKMRGLAGAVVLLGAIAPAWAAVAARPAGCVEVPAGESLATAVAAAPAGAAICLAPGRHPGPVVIAKPMTLWGPPEAVVVSGGQGSTLQVEAADVALLGFSVDGSGGRFDLLDAAVRIHGDRARVEGLRIRSALFGILAEQCHDLVLRGNRVEGWPDKALGLRGDGIRLWEVRGARVEDNRLTDSRDVVVWYSSDSVFVRNVVERGRYGTHFMYSRHNRIEESRYVGNVVGIFAMYSRDLLVRDTLLADSGGAAGVGLGLKESGNVRMERSWIVGNTVGLYLDTSPLEPDEWNRFEGNAFRFGEVAVVFHGRAARNRFLANRFADQDEPVRVEGRGDARAAEWRGNDWDVYAGYDLDGDGVGDLPFELRSLAADLAATHPSLRFFRGTPAMALVEWAGRVVPLFRPETLLVDEKPAMRLPDPPIPEAPRAG